VRIEVGPTSRLRELGTWLLNLVIGTSADATHAFIPWNEEAVVFGRATGKQLRVVRNDSSLRNRCR
jgi:hypothetical protein